MSNSLPGRADRVPPKRLVGDQRTERRQALGRGWRQDSRFLPAGLVGGNEHSQLEIIVRTFDPGQMPRDHYQAGSGRLLSSRLSSIALRHARWGGLTEAEKASAAAELREVAGDRGDLLAEVAGLALGSAKNKGPEYEARGQAAAELCRMAGADEALIPQWIQEGRRRAEAAQLPPFSRPGRPPRRP
jgi:hypothetical protein